MSNIHFYHILILCIKPLPRSKLLTTLKENAFENIEGKGKNAGNLFLQCLASLPETEIIVMIIAKN